MLVFYRENVAVASNELVTLTGLLTARERTYARGADKTRQHRDAKGFRQSQQFPCDLSNQVPAAALKRALPGDKETADAGYFAGFWLRHQRIGTR
jgi:hypothetical protein